MSTDGSLVSTNGLTIMLFIFVFKYRNPFYFLNERILYKANDSNSFQRGLSLMKKALNNLLIIKALQFLKVVPHVPICCIVMWSNVQ